MQVRLRRLSSIKEYTGNPRLNEKALEAVSRSIAEFGFRRPIVADEAGVVGPEPAWLLEAARAGRRRPRPGGVARGV